MLGAEYNIFNQKADYQRSNTLSLSGMIPIFFALSEKNIQKQKIFP